MFAIDTNLLVYAHNKDSIYNKKACDFLEKVMNMRDEKGDLPVCIPSQVLTEFLNVITRQNIEKPLLLSEAIAIVQDYIDTNVNIIYQRETQINTLIELLENVTTRKKIFDIALVATLKDNGIEGIYTVNVSDFIEFEFLKVKNPLIITE